VPEKSSHKGLYLKVMAISEAVTCSIDTDTKGNNRVDSESSEHIQLLNINPNLKPSKLIYRLFQN